MFSLWLAVTLPLAAASATFRWPDPVIDYVDEALYSSNIFLPRLTENCAPRENTTIAAQWLRIAYHDMATHNVDDDSGGLDASILYEIDRPQNIGVGMSDSLNDINFFTTPYVGLADMIAMGAVFAVASCGGPVIPFRAGRIDATEAGPATVPEPQQDLANHTESFRRQGFTPTEMITLVACGHALGGVRQVDFPTIVPADAPDGFANFTPKIGFDNTIVKQYLAGTTEDILVVGANTTTNSDLRIFSSDGNVTMTSLAAEDDFNNTCGTLLERMINTVPKEVTLTEPVDPIEHKVLPIQLYSNDQGSLTLITKLRFISTNANRNVTMFWKERTGIACPIQGCSVQSSQLSTLRPTFFGSIRGIESFVQYQFNATIDLNTSISKFWFLVDEKDGSEPYVVDNGGEDYVIEQDTVLYDPKRTSLIFQDFNANWALVVAVKTELAGSANVSIESYQPGTPTFLPIIETVQLQPDAMHPPANGYTFFTGNASTGITSIFVRADAGGQKYELYVQNDFID